MSIYGTVELGGTKTLVAVGTGPGDLGDPLRIPTTDPQTTLDSVVEFLMPRAAAAVGVACFGPLEMQAGPGYGALLKTPKPGWTGIAVYREIADRLAVPVGFDTDVNGAALGEGEWGAAAGLTDFVYVTVGTGIGGGAVVAGRTIHGLGHPEMGHTPVARRPGDDYPGGCPFHRDCLEGMAAGPALTARFGPPDAWEDQVEPLDLAVHYLAQGLRTIVYTLAPQRIVVGGGVSHIPGFHRALGEALVSSLAGYPGLDEHAYQGFVAAPGLGDRSGLAGGLVLARKALSS